MKPLPKIREIPLSPKTTRIPAELVEAYARDDARRERELAIFLADDQCQGKDSAGAPCRFTGWNHARREALQLRKKQPVAGRQSSGSHVFCPACAERYDKRKAKRGRAK